MSTTSTPGITAKSDAIYELVAEGSAVERLATGFTFTEGPIWHPDGYLLFSDMPGDVRRKYTPGSGVVEVMRPAFIEIVEGINSPSLLPLVASLRPSCKRRRTPNTAPAGSAMGNDHARCGAAQPMPSA